MEGFSIYRRWALLAYLHQNHGEHIWPDDGCTYAMVQPLHVASDSLTLPSDQTSLTGWHVLGS